MKTPCYCGGCDRCLNDQGLMTDSDIDASEFASNQLREELIAMADANDMAFFDATEGALGCDAYINASRAFELAAVKDDHPAMLAAAVVMRDALIDNFVESNLDAQVAANAAARNYTEPNE